MRVAVLGANHKTRNLGHHIAVHLAGHGHQVKRFTDSINGDLSLLGLAEHQAIVVSIGHTPTAYIGQQGYRNIESVVHENLTKPMKIVENFVRDTKHEGPSNRKIVLIGSMAHRKVLTGMSAYSAAKAGLDMFVRSAAFELAHKHIDVFGVHPGSIADTPMARKMMQGMVNAGLTEEEASAKYAQSWVREPLRSENVAEVVVSLLSGAFSQTSGATIEMAGGQR